MKTDKFGQELVECRICGDLTHMEGTKLCHRCWELETRIHSDPEIARKILKRFDAAVEVASQKST